MRTRKNRILSLKRQIRAAIAAGEPTKAQQLIEANPLEYSERDIYLAVCAAARAGDVRMFQYFFYRSGPDQQKLCAAVALMLAVKHERPAIVRSLAESGKWSATFNRPHKSHDFYEVIADRWINSPELVEIAYRRNDVEMMRLLIELGFRAQFLRNYDDCEALLQDAYRNRDIETLGVLSKLGYHACSKTQAETLLDAYQNRDIETFRGLVGLGYWSSEVARAICTDGDLARFAILFKATRWHAQDICGLVSSYPECLLNVLRASGSDRIADFLNVMMQPENWPGKDKAKRRNWVGVGQLDSDTASGSAKHPCQFCDKAIEFGDVYFGFWHTSCILRASREHAANSRSWSNQELFIAARAQRFEPLLELIRDKEGPSQVTKYEQEYRRRTLLLSVLWYICPPGMAGLAFST